jgi:hypothetical protein
MVPTIDGSARTLSLSAHFLERLLVQTIASTFWRPRRSILLSVARVDPAHITRVRSSRGDLLVIADVPTLSPGTTSCI